MPTQSPRPDRAEPRAIEPDNPGLAQVALALLGGAVAGALALLLARSGPVASLLGAEPKGFWYLSRASALVSFALLWFATALGLLITNRFARLWPGGPLAFDLHQFASSLGLLIGFFHAAILLADRYIGYTPAQLLVPFASGAYRPFAVGLGQVGAYLLVAIWGTSRLRLRIGQRWWRRVHFLGFVAFLLTLLHGLLAGSDSAAAGIRAFYWFTGGSVVWLTAYRALGAWPAPSRPPAGSRPARDAGR